LIHFIINIFITKMYNISDTVYLLSTLQSAIIIHIHQNIYTLTLKNNTQIKVTQTDITNDKDLVIQKLHTLLLQSKQDYQDSRDAWWRLKDETNYYKNIYLQNKK